MRPSLVSAISASVLNLALATPTALALHLTFSNQTYPAGAVFQSAADAAATSIVTQFGTIASTSTIQSFLNANSSASAVAGRPMIGPGSFTQGDFIVAFTASGVLGLGQGVSLSNGLSIPSNSIPPIGVGAQTGVTVAVSGKHSKFKVGGLDPNRLMYHASFFTMDLSQWIGHGITMKSWQGSLGMSYAVYGPKPWSPVIQYNGIRISSGFTYGSFTASYNTPFNLQQSSGSVTETWNNTINIGVGSSLFSFNTQAVTGFRILQLFDVFTGLGVDFDFGSTSITGGSSGPVTGTAAGTTVYTATGTVSTDSTDTVSPTAIEARWLVGVQVGLADKIGVYGVVTIATPSTYGADVGVRMSF